MAGLGLLSPFALYENRDLAVTTDFRDVFAELLANRMGIANLKPIFPGYSWMRRSDSESSRPESHRATGK